MDDVTRKVLRRVVAQTNGGIRKPFGVSSQIYVIQNDGYSSNREDLMVCHKDAQDYLMERIENPLSIDTIFEAIKRLTIRKVMES